MDQFESMIKGNSTAITALSARVAQLEAASSGPTIATDGAILGRIGRWVKLEGEGRARQDKARGGNYRGLEE